MRKVIERGNITSILEEINQRIKEQPEQIAIVDGNTTISYELLGDYIQMISEIIIREGIRKETVVGIYMERSAWSVAATLGILYAGAAFLPIDIKNSIDWAVFALNKSNAQLLLTADENVNLPGFTGKSISIQRCLETALNYEYKKMPCKIDSDLLAYVIFTSGTTGVSKGVQIEHGGMNNHLMSKIKLLDMDGSSVVAFNASIGFDISVWQMIAPLCVGGRIVVIQEKAILNIRDFMRIIEQHQVSILEVVPSYLIRIVEFSQLHNSMFNHLKYVLSTGEELRLEVLKRWFQCFDIPIVNAYGPTEASDDILHCILHKKDDITVVPIGTPIDNIELYIMKDENTECHPGEIGELWVSGICVGRGYIQDKVETSKHFAYDNKIGKRLYKTGDFVCLNELGEYLYYGRRDTQVKLFGQRIELKQIENAILSYPSIRDAAVINRNGSIVAFYLSNEEIAPMELKEYLNNKLPHFIVPKQFIKRENLEFSINGKVDYKKLLEQEHIDKTMNTQMEEGSLSIEQKVINIIEEITGEKDLVKWEDWKADMSVIGLNSATMIDMVVKLESEFDCEIEDKYLSPKYLMSFKEICGFLEWQKF